MADETPLLPERDIDCPHCRGSGKVRVPADVAAVEAYYFGCWGQSGHYWRSPDGHASERDIQSRMPEALREYRIDGCFPPGAVFGDQFKKTKAEIEGDAALHYFDGWTLLSYWDRSVDHRSASNSNLVARGTHSFATMLEIAKGRFPGLVERRKDRPITLVEQWSQDKPKWVKKNG